MCWYSKSVSLTRVRVGQRLSVSTEIWKALKWKDGKSRRLVHGPNSSPNPETGHGSTQFWHSWKRTTVLVQGAVQPRAQVTARLAWTTSIVKLGMWWHRNFVFNSFVLYIQTSFAILAVVLKLWWSVWTSCMTHAFDRMLNGKEKTPRKQNCLCTIIIRHIPRKQSGRKILDKNGS